MARINIEDSIYKDHRFMDLVIKTGSFDMAIGCLARAWSIAQDWFLNAETGGLVPVQEWEKQKINKLVIDVGLAEVEDGFIAVKGREEQFAWLDQKSSAGRKSAMARKAKKEDLTDVNGRSTEINEVQHTSTHVNGSQPLSLSPSLTHSHNKNKYIYSSQANVVRIDEVIQAFNDRLPAQNVGRIPYCKGLNRKQSEQFQLTVSHPEFSTLEAWKKLFELVAVSPLLIGKAEKMNWVLTLGWMVDYDKAKDIENGAFPEALDEASSEKVDWT